MFVIKYNITVETIVRLRPHPTDVEYPEPLFFEKLDSQDGNVVLQRALRDPRPRKWIWKGYRNYIPLYEAQWNLLCSLNTKALLDADANWTYVYIWEEDSIGENPYNLLTSGTEPDTINYSNLNWTKVRFIQTNRVTRKGGGRTTFEDSIVTFVHTV